MSEAEKYIEVKSIFDWLDKLNSSAVEKEDLVSFLCWGSKTYQMRPVRYAHWIKKMGGYVCSECGELAQRKYDYCHCGCKMEESYKTL